MLLPEGTIDLSKLAAALGKQLTLQPCFPDDIRLEEAGPSRVSVAVVGEIDRNNLMMNVGKFCVVAKVKLKKVRIHSVIKDQAEESLLAFDSRCCLKGQFRQGFLQY